MSEVQRCVHLLWNCIWVSGAFCSDSGPGGERCISSMGPGMTECSGSLDSGAECSGNTLWIWWVSVPTLAPGGRHRTIVAARPWWWPSIASGWYLESRVQSGDSSSPTDGEVLWLPIPESGAPQQLGAGFNSVTAPALGKGCNSVDSGQLHQLGSVLVKTVRVIGAEAANIHSGKNCWSSPALLFPVGWSSSEGIPLAQADLGWCRWNVFCTFLCGCPQFLSSAAAAAL